MLSQNEVNSVCNYKSTSDTLTALVPTLDPTSPFCKDSESLGTHLSAHKSTTLDGYMSQQRQTASMLGVGGEEAGHGGGGGNESSSHNEMHMLLPGGWVPERSEGMCRLIMR